MMQDVSASNAVTVKTYSRLHLGFLDLSAQPARQFGSLGMSIDAFSTTLTVQFGQENPALPAWVTQQLQSQSVALGLQQAVHLTLSCEIPRHAGLGSGTQMALAIGVALATLCEQTPKLAAIAHTASRGKRSGIGIGTFAQGGVVVDGGRGEQTMIPPILMRQAVPADWCVILIMANAQEGLHGQAEKSAFATLTPQSALATQLLASQVLMQGLPALCEANLEGFASCIAQLQRYNADYFAPAQGGDYAHPAVAAVLTYLKQAGHGGLGQTSWGPTGFVLLPSLPIAVALQAHLQTAFANSGLTFKVTQPVNHGAMISRQPALAI